MPVSSVHNKPEMTCLVIPARYGSTRFPGKPLALIDGIPMIVRVWSQATQARSVSYVLVATDHEDIKTVIEKTGGSVVMTPSDLPSGTDRVAAAVTDMNVDYVVNLQGDEPIINPEHIDAAVQALKNDHQADMATLACPIKSRENVWNQNIVKVLVNHNGHAVYFSRAPIPYPPADYTDWNQYLRHVGLYVYRKPCLDKLVRMKPVWPEQVERLEQLRALHYGGIIRVITVDQVNPGVDIPEDIDILETLIRERDLKQE
jgi:3-deoxy-manno-octulosonate cytidylyltransferase (CMP-KDO synthetase)